ncbi:transposase [Aliarcobacter cryaerophilus]|uniref:Transposase IS200-like domain-containing protein n=1 Tax=Aliarcobacter cryaerophilus TaxID=28198 RepID=A0A2S9SPW9_9BACT|nr:transposase [Aliarcobacter cryaerophilus]PRM88638.1 hypothetical protein CJ669_03130 [Aliarcobacter cryaerophilus]
MHKKLPHISIEEHYQFITFRTYDSLDYYAKNILNQEIPKSTKEYQLDIYLDSSKSGAYFYNQAKDILKNTIYEQNNILYKIEIFAIMPNHVHILLKQLSSLEKIVKHIKGKSAYLLNKHFDKSGKFWHTNYYAR